MCRQIEDRLTPKLSAMLSRLTPETRANSILALSLCEQIEHLALVIFLAINPFCGKICPDPPTSLTIRATRTETACGPHVAPTSATVKPRYDNPCIAYHSISWTN